MKLSHSHVGHKIRIIDPNTLDGTQTYMFCETSLNEFALISTLTWGALFEATTLSPLNNIIKDLNKKHCLVTDLTTNLTITGE